MVLFLLQVRRLGDIYSVSSPRRVVTNLWTGCQLGLHVFDSRTDVECTGTESNSIELTELSKCLHT
jgi:hypothetical protein